MAGNIKKFHEFIENLKVIKGDSNRLFNKFLDNINKLPKEYQEREAEIRNIHATLDSNIDDTIHKLKDLISEDMLDSYDLSILCHLFIFSPKNMPTIEQLSTALSRNIVNHFIYGEIDNNIKDNQIEYKYAYRNVHSPYEYNQYFLKFIDGENIDSECLYPFAKFHEDTIFNTRSIKASISRVLNKCSRLYDEYIEKRPIIMKKFFSGYTSEKLEDKIDTVIRDRSNVIKILTIYYIKNNKRHIFLMSSDSGKTWFNNELGISGIVINDRNDIIELLDAFKF